MLRSPAMAMPPLPRILLEQEAERRSPEPKGHDVVPAFLRLRHTVFRAHFPDGSISEPFTYDIVERERLDAVVVVAHFRDKQGERSLYLRSALRPPVAQRPREAWPLPEREDLGGLWELCAGLVEVDERSPEGLLLCAARELAEELGFEVEPSSIKPLGPSSFPAPGLIGERHFFFHVEVDPASQKQPSEDGSVLERGAVIVALPLSQALALVRAGEIQDEKTELGLRRLAEIEEGAS